MSPRVLPYRSELGPRQVPFNYEAHRRAHFLDQPPGTNDLVTGVDIFLDQVLIYDEMFAGSSSARNFEESGNIVKFGFAESGHPGVYQLHTSTSATGGGYIVMGSTSSTNNQGNLVLAGANKMEFGAFLKTDVDDLSTAAQRYKIFMGVGDDQIATAPTFAEQVMFSYTDDENSGKWLCTVQNSVGTTTANSGITVAINTWYYLRFVVNLQTSEVSFFVDGLAVGTVSTNLPTSSDQLVFQCGILKSVGTTQREMYLDAMYANFKGLVR